MIKEIINDVSSLLPIIVKTITWDDPMLCIEGENWNFFSVSSWRIINNDKLDCGCYDLEALESLKKIENSNIISIEIQSKHLSADPVFIFSNGYKLEIFSTTYYDPWTFRSPVDILYIGSPSDHRYL